MSKGSGIELRVVFFGIHRIGVTTLSALLSEGINVVAVVTKPGEEGPWSSVAQIAEAASIPVFSPESPKDREFIEAVGPLKPDIGVVSGYHRIIPAELLDMPRLGFLNVHDSLLPAYRGPNSWKWVIANGETHTGVTVHVMLPELDAGDILAQESLEIGSDETAGELLERICRIAAQLLTRVLRAYGAGTAASRPQDHDRASYFGHLTKERCEIDWTADTESIYRLIRAANPSPGAWTTLASGRRISLWEVNPVVMRPRGLPGIVLEVSPESFTVATGDGEIHVASSTFDSISSVPQPSRREPVRIAIGDQLGRFTFKDSSPQN